jgi:hypothetical protein
VSGFHRVASIGAAFPDTIGRRGLVTAPATLSNVIAGGTYPAITSPASVFGQADAGINQTEDCHG